MYLVSKSILLLNFFLFNLQVHTKHILEWNFFFNFPLIGSPSQFLIIRNLAYDTWHLLGAQYHSHLTGINQFLIEEKYNIGNWEDMFLFVPDRNLFQDHYFLITAPGRYCLQCLTTKRTPEYWSVYFINYFFTLLSYPSYELLIT